jgi:hypothetical protein
VSEIDITDEMLQRGIEAFLSCVIEEEVSWRTTELGPGLAKAFRVMLQIAGKVAE